MIASLLASDFISPRIDYHAIAPEVILAAGICLVLLVDLFVAEHRRWITSTVAGMVLLGATLPIITLATTGHLTGHPRVMLDGRYVVDNFSLVMKALFLLGGYVVVLMSSNEIEEGRYNQGEYYVMLLSSILGMVMIASARDLISLFVAFEFLSIPAYILGAWNKRDPKSNEAGIKYFLIGVFGTGVMLYGMSLLYGATGSTLLTDIGAKITGKGGLGGVEVLAVVFVIVGFAYKISAVPFHTWAPDAYEGAPTPVTAFYSVALKTGGFVAMLIVIYLAFPQARDVYQPFIWVMAALTMTVGNLLALRQTNMVRMLAYSSISQGGFVLMPLAVAGVAGSAGPALRAVIVYLIIYTATNLGAFAVVIAVSRKTRSGEISSWGGLFSYAPGLTAMMTIFFASLIGMPPFGGWYAKFGAFRAILDADNGWGNSLAVIAAINTVIASAYYIRVLREMWMHPVPDGDTTPVRVPSSLKFALGITGVVTLALGILPGLVSRYGNLTDLAGAFGH